MRRHVVTWDRPVLQCQHTPLQLPQFLKGPFGQVEVVNVPTAPAGAAAALVQALCQHVQTVQPAEQHHAESCSDQQRLIQPRAHQRLLL